MAESVDTKKKPGRPKKKIIVLPEPQHGIVNAPINSDDLFELVYSNPILFKKLMHLYKGFSVSEIELKLDPTGVRIESKDHIGKSTIYCMIDGKCMNLYYCKSPIKICIKRESLDRVLSTLGKNHYKISLMLKENYRSTMYAVIKDLEYNNEDTYEIDVIYRPEEQTKIENKDDDSKYPVKFKISSRHLKGKINTIRKMSSTFTIQKSGNEPLQFTFDKTHKVSWTGSYKDPSKIELISNLAPEEIFSASVNIEYIKPYTNSNIGEDTYISADKREKMCFTTYLDKKDIGYAMCIKIYTEIKDYRRQNYDAD